MLTKIRLFHENAPNKAPTPVPPNVKYPTALLTDDFSSNVVARPSPMIVIDQANQICGRYLLRIVTLTPPMTIKTPTVTVIPSVITPARIALASKHAW